MAIRNIVKEGDPILNKVCRPVTNFDDRLATLLDDMRETMIAADGVGLAGPQVGMLRRGDRLRGLPVLPRSQRCCDPSRCRQGACTGPQWQLVRVGG